MTEIKQSVSKPEEDVRLEKLTAIRDKGINPYPANNERTHTIHDALGMFSELEAKKIAIIIVGRVISLRRHGGSAFAHIQDGTGSMQVYFKKNEIDNEMYDTLEHVIDIADFIQVTGTLFKTQKGEPTLLALNFVLLTKSLLPLPEKHHGLTDTETRYRQRYLDLLANEEVKAVFKKRANIIATIRSFFDARGFLEVETPVLQPIPGGTSARPFITHHNALDADLYLRIAPELYLKRLIVGGFEKVYEIGRTFRNEGIDREHNPEFTMCEFYQAYANYHDLMRLTEELFADIISALHMTLKFEYQGKLLDFTAPLPRKTYHELLTEYADIDLAAHTNNDSLVQLAATRNIAIEKEWGRAKIIDELYKTLVRPNLISPTFVYDYPLELQALAKKKEGSPHLVEQFQLVVHGFELVKAYSELNDPLDQLERFQEQEKLREAGDDEAQYVDHDYITALKHGMPPTAGWGMGIDRLTAILTNASNLKEVILFPTLKPIIKNNENSNKVNISSSHSSVSYEPFPREKALELLHEHVHSESLRRHMYAAEAVMRALARKFGENEDAWGLAGLLHDIDWEETENDMSQHTVNSKKYLTEAGIDPAIVHAIYVHNDTHGIPLKTLLEKTLYTAEELTGLITACAHVLPDKKLENVKASSIKKKFKQKAFAAGVNRDIIAQCEELTGITLDELIEIELEAMKEIANELGL